MMAATNDILEVKNYINNDFLSVPSYIDSYEPSKGKVWAKIPDSDAACVDLATTAAKEALKT